MSTRFVNCTFCQTEGRILTNDGGPDDVDHGICPACNGERVVEVVASPIGIDDLEDEEINSFQRTSPVSRPTREAPHE